MKDIVKRTLSTDNLITFADLGYFGSYGGNVKQALLRLKYLESENFMLREHINKMMESKNELEVKEE